MGTGHNWSYEKFCLLNYFFVIISKIAIAKSVVMLNNHNNKKFWHEHINIIKNHTWNDKRKQYYKRRLVAANR
jgi:hypothetical protein